PMNSMETVPRKAQRPNWAGSRAALGPPPSSPRPIGPCPVGAPGRSTRGTGRGARASRISVAMISVPRFDGQRRLVLHHEILRRARIAVLVGPTMDLGDGPRPVAMRGRGRGRPLEAVGVPGV